MSADNGGSAFPRMTGFDADSRGYGANTSYKTQVEGGMSLRDWFAGMALPSVLPERSVANMINGAPADTYTKLAYSIADAMLRSRASGADQGEE